MTLPAMKVYIADGRAGTAKCALWVMKGNAACPATSVDIDSPAIPSFPDGGWKRFTPNPDKYWTVKLASGQRLTGKNNLELVRVTGSLS